MSLIAMFRLATRWAPRVKPVTLQRLMHHKSIETTLKFYVDQDADEIADEMWRNHGVINQPVSRHLISSQWASFHNC